VLIGTVYAVAARDATSAPVAVTPISMEATTEPAPEPIPEGVDVTPEALEALALLEAERRGELVDVESGLRIGALTILPRPEPVEPVAPPAARPARRAPTPTYPRLSPDPGQNVIMVARRMMAQDDVIEGSCYRYLSEVFARAGNEGWRNRSTVFHAERNGPYANLDLIRPGDWLYIVNHPESTPVGTHSVLFVSWIDRSRGHAQVIEHSGWGSPSAGQERGYDVSRTYGILRPR
jgi:hypothetical protein